MVEHAGGEAGLLDDAVPAEHRPDPAQVDLVRTHRPAPGDDAGAGGEVGDGVEDLARRLRVAVELPMRASMISTAGVTNSVAARTSASVTPGPRSGRASPKASSTSTRGAMKRSRGMSPSAKNMSSSSGAKSGSSICDESCIAREVRPILRPLTTRPSASRSASQARWIA